MLVLMFWIHHLLEAYKKLWRPLITPQLIQR